MLCADWNEQGVKETERLIKASSGTVIAMTVDVRDEDQVKKMVDTCVEQWGTIDAMFANAGVSYVLIHCSMMLTHAEFPKLYYVIHTGTSICQALHAFYCIFVTSLPRQRFKLSNPSTCVFVSRSELFNHPSLPSGVTCDAYCGHSSLKERSFNNIPDEKISTWHHQHGYL